MIRVTGIIKSPIDEPIEYTSLLLQTINGSLEVLPNSYAHIELDETGKYDFNVLNGSYRVYANYENSMKVHILGEFTVSNGMNEPSYTLNQLVSNYSPQAPDWAVDLDNKWQGLFDDLVEDANTRFNTVNQAIADGDAQVIFDMTTLVNDEIGASAAILTEQISAGDANVLNQGKAYTDDLGNEVASQITQVSNSVTNVSQQLTAYKDTTDISIAAITSRIDTNEANLISEISAEVNAQTGEMELRIENSIGTEVANISEQISVVQDDLDNQKAAWQVVATVDDLTSSVGMTNDGTNSIIYMQAESLVLTNDNSNIGSQTAPFVVEGGVAYINNAVIKELKGNNISTTATIIAGAGNAQAGLNGLDSGIYNTWRLWSGNANPSLAPFRVDRTGKLWATNAVIAGNITASSGTLDNVTINDTCTITGTLQANQIIGDVVAAKAFFVNTGAVSSETTIVGNMTVTNTTGGVATVVINAPTAMINYSQYLQAGSSASCTGIMRVYDGNTVIATASVTIGHNPVGAGLALTLSAPVTCGAVARSIANGVTKTFKVTLQKTQVNTSGTVNAVTATILGMFFRNGGAWA